jgi:hypothetical protein
MSVPLCNKDMQEHVDVALTKEHFPCSAVNRCVCWVESERASIGMQLTSILFKETDVSSNLLLRYLCLTKCTSLFRLLDWRTP